MGQFEASFIENVTEGIGRLNFPIDHDQEHLVLNDLYYVDTLKSWISDLGKYYFFSYTCEMLLKNS